MKLTNLKFLGIAILLNGVAVIARGDALDNWTTSQINTNVHWGAYFDMASVTYGNGRYVAVGSDEGSDFGLIETSEDGVNWTVRGERPDYNPPMYVLDLFKVTYGNGTFVAVGFDGYGVYGNLYNSTNGITWTSHTNATVSNFCGVTYGGGLFVAVGDGWIPMSNNTGSLQKS